MRGILTSVLAIYVIFAAVANAQVTQLLVAYDNSCGEFSRWQSEVAPFYASRPEGHAAPLIPVSIDGRWPDGLVIGPRPRLSPTFILLRDGHEIDRTEGYSNPPDFYARLDQMLQTSGISSHR